MKEYTQFDISDYGAQRNPGWRVRWGADGSNAVLLTSLDTPKPGTCWKLIYAPEDVKIILDPDGQFRAIKKTGDYFVTADSDIHERIVTFTTIPKNCPKILRQAAEEHRNNIPAPRYKEPTPYIDKDVAEELEKKFFDELIAPYINTHTVYAVANSGTLLCKRLGITNFSEIYVNHYESNTFQNDRKPSVKAIQAQLAGDSYKPVLVIDDMVSSGHTAAAILEAFKNVGVSMVRYTALFNIVASRENFDVDSAISTLIAISNFYWMFGRGMDLIDEPSRKSKHIYGAQKNYEDAGSQEDFDDLFNFFNQ